MKITLYTTEHCPVCKMLKESLEKKKITFEMVDDIEIMSKRGIMSAPMLDIEGELMNAKGAINWIKTYKQEEL